MSTLFKPVFRPLLAVSVVLSVAPAFAEEDTTLSPVVVSATRVATPQEQLGSSVTVITANDIAAMQERTLPDVLETVPGLSIVQNGGPGGLAQVFIRGTNQNHTKILIDGIDASDPSSVDGSFDFSQILTSDIKQIEVLRGPQSGLYGSDAIGGVINIITKDGSGPPKLTGSIEGGSFRTLNETTGISGSMDRFSYAFNAANLYSGATPVTPTALIPAGRTENDDVYDNKTVSTKLGAKLTDNLDVGLTARYVVTNLNSTSDDGTGPETHTSTSNNHETFSRATAHLVSFDGKLDQTAGIAYTGYHRAFVDPNPTTFSAFADDNGDRIKGDWQGNIMLTEGQTLTLGAEHQLDQIDDPSQPVTAQMVNDAGDIQLQSAFGKQLFNTISVRDDDNNMFGNHVTWREAPAYLITETDTKLKATYGTGFKAPTLDELFDNYPAFGFNANPNLRPETSRGYDIGFEQSLWKKTVQFGSTYFHNDIKDLIAANDTFTTDINVGRATTKGFENFVTYKPLKELTLRADYTFTIADNDITHQELLRRPKNKATFTATWQATPKLSFSGSVLYNGSWVDDNRDASIQGLRPGGYAVVNLASEYKLNDRFAVFGRIDNALDKQYQNPVGFERPGFGIFGGLKVAIDTGKDKP
jgi:vitamin B12 transporter